MTTNEQRLLDFAASIGVTVRFDDPEVPEGSGDTSLWRAVGVDPTGIPLGVNGLAYTDKPLVSLSFRPGAPEWLRAGILAHELGHKVDKTVFGWDYRFILMNSQFKIGSPDWENFDLEARASERAYELMYGLGIALTPKLVAVLNFSIGNYALNSGLSWEDGEERFL